MTRKPTGRDADPPGGRGSTAEIAVLDATERLLATHAIHDVAVAQILVEAGLSRASFYKYFASKHDVLLGLLRRIFAAVPVAPPAGEDDVDPGVRVVLRQAMGLWAQHVPVIRAAVESMHVVPEVGREWAAMREQLVAALAPRIRAERQAHGLEGGPPAEMLATLLIHGVERAFYVAANGLDDRLPGAPATFDALDALTAAAVGGAAGPVPERPDEVVPR